MEDFEFWGRQKKIDVLTAAYLLAGQRLPDELSYSVNITNYPPRVGAAIRSIEQETGALVREPYGSDGGDCQTEISQADFRRLAEMFGVRLESDAPIQKNAGWPWGNYETSLLRALAEAAEKFWILYDPTDPATAPLKEQVVEWLQGRGISENVAKVMASILRADELRTGPRK
jgi:hypothetical protein